MNYAQALQALLPMIDGIYDAWQEAAEHLRGELAERHPHLKVSCRKGCGACCHFPIIPATAGEAFILLNRMLAEGADLAELHARFSSYAQDYFAFARAQGTLPFTDAQQSAFLSLRLPCPLLNKTPTPFDVLGGACSVFNARPLICDYFHSTEDPRLCTQKKPHFSFSSLVECGETAVEEVRAGERQLFGRSALGHLPLLLAALCTSEGLVLFLDDSCAELPAESADAQAERDFEFYRLLLGAAGYEMGVADIESLIEAQQALTQRT